MGKLSVIAEKMRFRNCDFARDLAEDCRSLLWLELLLAGGTVKRLDDDGLPALLNAKPSRC
jgi:hypothetical protein